MSKNPDIAIEIDGILYNPLKLIDFFLQIDGLDDQLSNKAYVKYYAKTGETKLVLTNEKGTEYKEKYKIVRGKKNEEL